VPVHGFARCWRSALVAGLTGLLGGADVARAEPRLDRAGGVSAPHLFAEHVVSTEDDEGGGTFSPDGTEFYFVKFSQYTTFPRFGAICVSRLRGGRWTQPEVVSFSGGSLDFPPKISPDGKTMYFSSFRPLPGKTGGQLRIWSVERSAGGWGTPQPLPAPVNAPESAWNWAPSVTRDGTLYFASTRDGNGHIYRSRRVDGAYAEPEKLGPEINSEFNESDPYISPDEKILLFASSGVELGDRDRSETLKGGGVLYGRGYLYVSVSVDGRWSPARHLEHQINSVFDESTPAITPDGRFLFFSSERSPFTIPAAHRLDAAEIDRMLRSPLNGHGNIYFIGIEALDLNPVKAKP
jgi:hypothetical protein